MKIMVENSKTARKRFENGSETAAKRLVNVGRFLAMLLVLLTIGIGNVWGVQIYKNEGADGTADGITVTGNVNTNSKNGNPGNSLANTSSSNTTFTFTGFSVSNYGSLKLSIDAKFGSFPSTTNTWPYATVTFKKNNVAVKTDNTTIKWSSKDNSYSTYTIDNIPDFDKIEIVGSPAIGKTGAGKDATNYSIYMDNITLTGCPNPTSLTNGTITSSTAQLSWSDASDVGSYEVYRSTSSTAPEANADPTTTVNTTSVTLESLTASTTYYWWVRTKCSSTEKSAWVAGSSFTTSASASCADPSAPGYSSVSGTGVTISTTSAAANYDIYLSTSSTTPTTQYPTATTSSANSKAITDLSYGTTYYYWMRKNCGGGSTSSWVAGSPTTFTTTVPAPSGVSAGSISMNGATFTITDANSVNNYDIYYSEDDTNPEAGTTPTTTSTSTTKAVTSLKAGTTYYYWVRAKGPNAKSAWVGGSTFTTLTLSSISISTAPTTKYLEGDNFDPTGLVITRTYSNSTSDTYTYSGHTAEFSFSPATNAALTDDDDKVTITYGGKTVNQSINVYTVTVNKVNMSSVAIVDDGVTASCSGRTLSQSVGSTNYKFNSYVVSAGGVSVSDGAITGTPTGNVTINAKFHAPITVTWKVGHGSASGGTGEVKYGTAITALPSPPADDALESCGTDKFMGWSKSELTGTGNSAPADLFTTVGGATTLTENTTYRAVFAKSTSGAAANTILFSENWEGVTASTTPLSPTEDGSSVYGGATITYTWTNGGTTTQTYTNGGPNGDENILISKSNGAWKASGIKTGNASKIVFTYAMSGSGVLAVSSPTSNVTVGGSSSGSYITFSAVVSTFDLEFKNTNGSNNLRLDDIVVKVYTAGTTYFDYQTSCCEDPGTALSITSASSVATGGTVSLTSTGGNGGTVTWSVVNGTGSASISEGVLTAGNVGTVTVKAHQDATGSYCAQDAEQTFTVVASTVDVTGVTVAPTSKAIVVGETFTITPTVAPADATDKTVSWTSSASDKASVSSGMVTGVAKGSATITCTTNDGSFTDDCAVTVYNFTVLTQDEEGTDISGVSGISASHTGKALSASAGSTNYVFKTWKYDTGGQGGLDAISSATSASTTLTGTPTGDVRVIAEFYKPLIVNWSVNGDVTETTAPHDGAVTALPTAPTSSDCDDAKVFVGWRATEISGTSASDPGDIFNTVGDVPDLDNEEETTFYAVFADENVFNEEMTNSELSANVTTTACAYGTEKTWTDNSKIAYAFSVYTDAASRPWVQMKKEDNTAYIKITAPQNITKVEMSITDPNNESGGITDITKHGALASTVTLNLNTSASTNSTNSVGSVSGDASSKDLTITVSSPSNKTLYLQPIGGACRIWGIKVYYTDAPYKDYVTTCSSCDADATFTNTTPAVSDIDCTSATLTATGGLKTKGAEGCNISDYGFVIGTADNPAIDGSGVTKLQVGTSNPTLGADFSYDVTGLTKGTKYYVRAYAINKHGTAYSTSTNFWTKNVSSIAITQAPAKTKYIAGETFDPAGMEITATMANGDEVDVTADVTYSESALTSGTNQDFDITYSLCDVDKVVTQTIDVYTLTVTEGTNPSYGEVSASGALITVTPTSGNIGVPTVTSDNAELRDNNDNTYTVINPTGNVSVTINYRAAGPTVVHYYVNGVEITSLKGTPTEGSSFDLPDASAVTTAIAAQSVSSPDPTNYPNFWGWSRTPVHPQSTAPDVLSGSTKVYTETSFYAVYTNMSKIRIDETVITATTYVTSETDLTAGGLTNGFKYIYVMKENKTGATDLQFKKSYGYIYNLTSISNLKHVDIGLGGESRIDVFACSAANEKSGSALSDADTRTDAYVYMMPASTSYFLVEADNLYTYYIDYIDIYYGSGEELYMTTFKNVFNPTAASGNWSSTANWEDGVLPNIHEEVWIKKPVTVNITDAQAKSIVIDQSSTNTGSITIPAGKALVVAETVKKTTDGETLSATEVADLHIGSSSTGNGSLVMGSHDGTNKAQVDFYTKARKTAENNWVNQYIGTPFNVADGRGVKEDYYGSYLYSFDFGTQSWVNIKDEDYHFTPFLGYNIIRKDAAEATLEMQGTLVATTNQSPTVYFNTDKADSENVLANSWTAPIKIANFDATPSTGDFTNVEATIYIFNAGGAADAADKETLAGQYSTYSVGTAGSAVIPSMQSFSVYATAAAPSLTLNYARLVYNPAVAGIAVQPNYAPRRMKAAAVSEEMQPIRLRVSGESGYADELKIYLHEDFSDAFENGWDAHKMYGYPETPQLYAVTDDGELAILCAPDADATLLGFKAGEADTEYTFSFRYDSDEPLFLLDMQNNTYTEVQTGNAYTFQTSDVGAHNRFVLTRFAPQTPTGVEEPTSDSSLKGREAATKFMIDNRIYILLRGVLYDATGKRVRVTNERVNE